jgi:hypothetical protein
MADAMRGEDYAIKSREEARGSVPAVLRRD